MFLETIGAFATLAAVLQTWKASSRGKKEAKLRALSELSSAVATTTKALARKTKKGERQPDLVNVWRQAAIALDGAGEKKLSRLCEIKGMYWLNHEGWTPEQVKAAGIQLRSMELELRRLLAS